MVLTTGRPKDPASEAATNDTLPTPVDPLRSSVSLTISLRYGRLVVLVLFAVIGMMTMTLLLSHGTELTRFDRHNVSLSDQVHLLDNYNSYSGNIASAIGRVLEIFVALLANTVVVWLLTNSVLTAGFHWRVRLMILALSASVGFLLTNSLNGLNVQVRELPPIIVMSASDLSIQMNNSGSSTVESSLSERTPKNPSINTIFRNLILPRASTQSTCQEINLFSGMKEDDIKYGIPQRPWMKSFLPEALPVASIQIDLKTNETTSTATEFPMNVSIIADLLVNGVFTQLQYAPFDVLSPFNLDTSKWYLDHFVNDSNQNTAKLIPTSRLAGLLPPDPASTEMQDREWFLAHVPTFVRAATSTEWQNTSSLLRWTLDISRVNITPSVWIDTITIESEVIAMNQSTYATFASSTGLKIIKANGPYPDEDGRFADAQIHAYAVCMNQDGTEILYSNVANVSNPSASIVVCQGVSNTSMDIFSSGRHLIADSLDEVSSVSEEVEAIGGAKNLRIVYSTTFARMRCRLEDLSEVYNAVCDVPDGCYGLHTILSNTNQHLLVSSAALPITQLRPVMYSTLSVTPKFTPQNPLEIVTVHRPSAFETKMYGVGNPRPGLKLKDFNFSVRDTEKVDAWSGDVLLPHNLVNNSRGRYDCAIAYDRRVQNYVNNHIYMETTLQPTYIAAGFFLFQNGMARDVLNQTMAMPSMSLKLDNNVQEMSVWLSIPTLNANLTLAGCIGLVVVLVVIVARSFCDTATPRMTNESHQIARVMVDDTTFPPLLLNRNVNTKDLEGDADQFVIQNLTVRPSNTNPLTNAAAA